MQLPQERQRSATSSHRGCSRLRASSAARPSVSSERPIPARAPSTTSTRALAVVLRRRGPTQLLEQLRPRLAAHPDVEAVGTARAARSGPGRTPFARRDRCPWTCRSRWQTASHTPPRRSASRRGGPCTDRRGPRRRRGRGRVRRAPPARRAARPRWPVAGRVAVAPAGTRLHRSPSPATRSRWAGRTRTSTRRGQRPSRRAPRRPPARAGSGPEPGCRASRPAGRRRRPTSPCTIAPSRATGPTVRYPRAASSAIRRSSPSRSMTASSPARTSPNLRRNGVGATSAALPSGVGGENDDQCSTAPPTTVARSTRRLE